jgi:hypothetical protein
MKKLMIFLVCISSFVSIAQQQKIQSCQGVFASKSNPTVSTENGYWKNDTVYLAGITSIEARFNSICPLQINPLTVDWYRNGVLYATTNSFNNAGPYYYDLLYVSQPGVYQAFFSGFIYPAGTSTVTVLQNIASGIEKYTLSSCKIYPNPTEDRVYIELPDENKITCVYVYDITGSIVQEYFPDSSSYTIQLPKIKGFYFVKIISGESTITKKILKSQ